MAGIPLSWLVDITSVGVRDTFALSKLPTLLITKYNQEYITPKWAKYYDAETIKQAHGAESSVTAFANNYFSVVNKMASKADLLNVFTWNESATPAVLQGGKVTNIEQVKLEGAFSLTIGEDTRDIVFDTTESVSFTDVATKLQEAIRGAGTPTPTTLTATAGTNTNFVVAKGTDGANTQVLSIKLDNADTTEFEAVNSDDSKATFDKDSKTITGKAQGTTTLSLTCKKQGFNKVRIDVTIAVSASPFNITTTIGNAIALDNTLTITTNAGDFSAEVANTDFATFDKASKTITGKAQGSTTLTIKAKYGDASEVSKVFDVVVAQTTLAISVTEKVAARSRMARAGAVNPLIPSFAEATCIYDTNKQGFRITSGTSGDITIGYASEPTQSTDASNELGLTQASGAKIFNGRDLVGSFDNILSEINIDNGAYFVICADWELSEAEQASLANFVSTSNNRYLGVINSTNEKLLTDEDASASLKGYNGIILNYYKDIKAVNGFTEGLISAINFSQTNGNVNLAFSDATSYTAQSIKTEAELNTLEANLANSILEFSQIGQSQAWYGMGNIMGTLTNSANVYIGNAYLAFQLQLQFANMFNAQGFIGLRGKNNEGIITSYAESVFSGCVNNGIIVQGAELTTTEEQKLISAFGDKGESAITQCSRAGYFYLIGTPDLTNQTIPLSVAYVANKATKRLVITNYVLGA